MGRAAKQHRGSGMVEVLVTLILLTVGLLGLVQLMSRSTTAEYESYQRAQALVLLNDMVDKINSNRRAIWLCAASKTCASCAAVGTRSWAMEKVRSM